MTRFPRLAVLLAATALLTAAAPATAQAADAPTATAAKSCGVKDSRSYGTTYVLSIRAKRVSCRKARERVRAFHDCRPGKRGRCPNLGAWNCSENRESGAGSYTSDVKCKKGRKVVKHTYTQWT
jgi:hypothetical protein